MDKLFYSLDNPAIPYTQLIFPNYICNHNRLVKLLILHSDLSEGYTNHIGTLEH